MPSCQLLSDGTDVILLGDGFVPGQSYVCRLQCTTVPSPQFGPDQPASADAGGQVVARWARQPGQNRYYGSVWSSGVRLAKSAVLVA